MYTGSFVAQQAGCLHVGSKFECYRILRCASFDLCLLWWGFVEAAWFFFFSSRRRHTRFDCDWTDVCSSDLVHSASSESWAVCRRPWETAIELLRSHPPRPTADRPALARG